MTIPNEQLDIIWTERGRTIAGTRITLYDVMDYVMDQYPPKFIQGLFELTEEQINTALAYIEANTGESVGFSSHKVDVLPKAQLDWCKTPPAPHC